MSPWHVTRVTETMLDNQNPIAPVAKIVDKETEKAEEVDSKRVDRCRKFVVAAYTIGAPSASSGGRPSTNISDDRTNKTAHSEMSEEQAPELLS